MDFSEYRNTLDYPSESDFKTYQVNCLETNKVLHKGISLQELNDLGIEFTGEEKYFYENYVIICHTDEAAYDKAMSAYYDEYERLSDKFHNDLRTTYLKDEHQDNMKLHNVIYSEAYERGHSHGNSEIACYYQSLAL